MRAAALPLAFLLLAAPPLAAQVNRPLRLTPLQQLDFGLILAGVSSTVAPTDGARSGQVDLAGPNRARIALDFALPTVLTSAEGNQLPVVFGSTSAGYSASSSIAGQVFFDPRTTYTTTLSNTGRARVFVGATVTPAGTQPAGTYTGVVTLTVTVLGL